MKQILRRLAEVAAVVATYQSGIILANGQDLAHERASVLASIGRVKVVEIPLHPLAVRMGLVFAQDVSEPTALGLRVHFKVRPQDRAASSWGIQILDRNGTVAWSTSAAEVIGSEFWSDEIDGSSVKVELYSSISLNPVVISIDKIAILEQKAAPVSISGPNQLGPIRDFDNWIIGLGHSVARVRFVADDGMMYVCTAFLLTPDLLLTNQHCIATRAELESAQVDFDFDAATEAPDTRRLGELVQSGYDLDYSVVRLITPVDRPPLRLDRIPPPDHSQLLIIQHPAGEPKQVSMADCKVDGALVPGRNAALSTDFGHQCDTKGGSSGSPVLLVSSKKVVGLHHLGFTPGGTVLRNRAVHIDRVLADLSPATRAEIEAAQLSP